MSSADSAYAAASVTTAAGSSSSHSPPVTTTVAATLNAAFSAAHSSSTIGSSGTASIFSTPVIFQISSLLPPPNLFATADGAPWVPPSSTGLLPGLSLVRRFRFTPVLSVLHPR
ncbi:unnamed protein product [Cuscuta europaea]|uniref:Uncharacterized protein n=1 Tax=Cuscuta europaea TaxID=41803 RepID=A0A9P0ZAZ2_CUSEU|nr:unnamed protein product [Cuscuta europaea]